MKILFAVSNENVSKRIVDSYQKKYGEAVSFKNVFYFNAIIREIHKDKTYDRIVISEDLEPFASSNYDVIDRFILERMKQITNEVSAQERYIDIVLICTDRRTKSGFVLSKMFEFGIYNALVGQDRRIDNVCTLLNTPRTAEEAKDYYNISSQNDTSSVDDVSEQEVQNILLHYKRLGRNEDRYTDSFNNIASQYTDKQLKIIIKCLPINVRAVLEAECPKYQELVTYAEETDEERKQKQKIQEQRKIEQIENDRKLKQRMEKERKEAERNAQRNKVSQERSRNTVEPVSQSVDSGIDLLDNKRSKQRMTGNVIIPNNMNIRNERKIYTDEELDNISNSERPLRTVTSSDLESAGDTRNTIMSEPESMLPGFDNIEEMPQSANNTTQSDLLSGFDELEDENQLDNNMMQSSTLPGYDDFQDASQEVTNVAQSNTLPEFDDFQNGSQQVANVPQSNPLPGFDDFQDSSQSDNNIPQPNPLPGFDDFQDVNQPVANMAQPNPLPGLDDSYDMPQPANNVPVAAKPSEVPEINEEPLGQMQMNNVVEQPEVPQEPKRGRGRPRKYPVEPPKPKGKRGRPRKNPLPEETEQKTQIIPGINDFENIPEFNKMDPTESSSQIPVNPSNNVSEENSWNQNLNQESNSLQGVDDWSSDPFATPVGQSNNMQNTNNDWNQDPFADSTQSGTDDWSRDPFATTNKTNNIQTTDNNWNQDPFADSAQSETDDWNQDPFAATNQTNNMQTADNDWNQDPFADSTQDLNTMPGTDDWAQDPFTTNQTNNMQTSDDDWNRDPFGDSSQNMNDLQGNDDWNQDTYSTSQNSMQNLDDDWNRDPFEDSTQNMNNLQEKDDWNQNSYLATSNNMQTFDDDGYQDPFADSIQDTNTLPGNDAWNDNQFDNATQDINNNETDDDWSRDPFEIDNNRTNNVGYNDNQSFSSSATTPQYNVGGQNYNNYQTQYQDTTPDQAVPYSPSQERRESIQKIEENKLYTTGSLNTVLTKDKKIVAFVGTSKSGTSFLVNNLACLFSSIGVRTAILDMTKNKNSYYIYTDNNESLRNIAYTSIENLENGIAEGIKVDRNLNVYTSLPNDNKDYSNAEAILSTLAQNESLILIDCDFNTDFGYFANAQEIYLVQSMDILTIQPLTAFLRELKTKGLLDEEKLRVVINKELRVKSLSSKAVIGGMSFYIDPAMSYMTDLFNKDKVKACTIPFDESVYAKYIEQTVNCAISISGYNKSFMNSLKILGNMVYPLLSKQTYNSAPRNSMEARNYGNNFSNEMNNTLNQMKNKY